MNTKTIIDRSLRKVQALKSYWCVMELYGRKNGKKIRIQRYLYKAPGDIRIQQIGHFMKGAVLVIRSNGKIRAQGGGLLSVFKVSLDKDSDLIRGVTGDSAVESDWSSILNKAKKMAPFVVKTAVEPLKTHSIPEYEIVTFLKNQPYDKVRLILRDDGPILLLERFQNRKLTSRIVWKNVELNPEVSNADFEL